MKSTPSSSTSSSTLLSRRDLDFLLFEWLRIDKPTKLPRFAEHSRETFADVLDLSENLAERRIEYRRITDGANHEDSQ